MFVKNEKGVRLMNINYKMWCKGWNIVIYSNQESKMGKIGVRLLQKQIYYNGNGDIA